jgi:hypothetical protein
VGKYSTSRKFVGVNKGGTKAKRSMGTSMGGTMEKTKGRRAREAKKRRDEEAYWASLSGPVTISYTTPTSEDF